MVESGFCISKTKENISEIKNHTVFFQCGQFKIRQVSHLTIEQFHSLFKIMKLYFGNPRLRTSHQSFFFL